MIKIDGKELIFNQTLIISRGKEATFSISNGPSLLEVSILFENPEAEKPSATWVANGQMIKFTFSGWKSSLGSSLKEPQRLGEVDGSPFYMNFAHHWLGETDLLTIQFLKG